MESPKAYKGCLLRWKLKYQTTLKESSYPCGRGISSEITSEDYYDFIIVDEFHHAAAPSYQRLLSYYKPKVLLGLTATPERNDNKDIFKYFEDRISGEIRLPEAIDRKLLSPFQYFAVSD